MDLIVEDGTGLTNANSFVSVAEADLYHANLANTTWAALSADTKAILLFKACQYMETRYRTRWIERRTYQFQALSWPRAFINDHDRYPIPANGAGSIPTQIKAAQCELALKANTQDLLPDLPAGTSAPVTSESVTVGPITTSKSYGGGGQTPNTPKFRAVEMMIAQFMNPPGYTERS